MHKEGMTKPRVAAFALSLLLLLPSFALAARYELIVNKSVEVDSLSKSELQAIFLGEKVKWNNKKYIKIVLFDNADVLKDFLQSIVGKTPAQFDTHWNKLVFTGKASMPASFTDSDRVIEFVAGKPGAIGIVAAGQLRSSVKAISVQQGDR